MQLLCEACNIDYSDIVRRTAAHASSSDHPVSNAFSIRATFCGTIFCDMDDDKKAPYMALQQ